jgi:hypothetical protein
MIINDKIEINITNRNIKYYRSIYPDIKVGMNLIDTKNIKNGSDIKLEVTCDICERKLNKKFNNLNRDRKNNNGIDICIECSKKKSGENRRIAYETVYNLFLSKNLIPEFKKYDNILTNNKLKFRCKIHTDTKQSIRYNGLLLSNYPCKYCRSIAISKSKKKSFQEIYNYFISRDLIPLFKEEDVNGISSKLKFRCKKHNIDQYTSYAILSKTKGCKFCFSKKGSNSHMWKGGITPLVRNMRKKINNWKKEKIKEKGYKCEITNMNGRLVVHHILNFHILLEKSLESTNLPIRHNLSDYTNTELLTIENELLELHKSAEYCIIIKDLHILFHKIYGSKNNDKLQFESFKKRYFSFEFDNDLDIKYRYSTISNHYQL